MPPSDCFPSAVEVKMTTPLILRSFTVPSNYSFIVLNVQPLAVKLIICL